MERTLIVGAGFAGMYAALSAARLRDEQGMPPAAFEITVAAPGSRLVIRPRAYERTPETLVALLRALLQVFYSIRSERLLIEASMRAQP